MKDLLRLNHITPSKLNKLLELSSVIKTHVKQGNLVQPLVGKSMGMIFAKRSTRTRVSTETGFGWLGGQPVFLSNQDIQLGVNESVKDTGRVLSRLHDILLARVYKHEEVEELAKESSIPVINGLSDLHHPLQALADYLTVQEHFGKNLKGLKLAWIGDGNNVLHSLLEAAPKLGVNVSIATPVGYQPNQDILKETQVEANRLSTSIELLHDPKEAVKNANIIVTDTWVSMGDEHQKEQRLKDFSGFQVTKKLLQEADTNWKFLHCLPRKPEEVSDEVFYSTKSLVWDEAENRKYTVMAVILQLLGKDHAFK